MTALHTEGNQVPSIDGTDLGGVLEDLAGIHAGIDLIRDGLRLIAHDRLTTDQTQTLAASLAGSPDCDVLTAIAYTVARIVDADLNPALRTLPLDTQKTARLHGEQTVFAAADPDLHQPAADAAAAIAND